MLWIWPKMLKSEERGDCYNCKQKENPKNKTICCMYDMAGQGLKLSMRNLLISFSTRNTKQTGLDALEFHARRVPISIFIRTYRFIVLDKNMWEVLVAVIVRILNSREHWPQSHSSGLLCCMPSHCCKLQSWRTRLSDTLWTGSSFLGMYVESGLQKGKGYLLGS
jgi:hypothetical protein